MDEAQIKKERMRAKAKWQLLKLELRSGKATEQQVQEAQLVWERIGQYTYVPPTPTLAELPLLPETSEMKTLLVKLERQRAVIDVKKRHVSMRLQTVPASRPCPELTKEILDYRAQWEELGDAIQYVRRYGHLPSQEPEDQEVGFPVNYAEDLPRDKWELDRMMKNMAINVNHRWPKLMAKAKTTSKKAEYKKRIAIGTAQYEVMKALFMTI